MSGTRVGTAPRMRTRKRRTRETRRRKRKKGPVEGEETKGRVEGERPTGDVDSRDGDSKPPTEAPRTRKAIRQACDETANNARPVGASACRASGASDEAVHAHAQGCPASEQEGAHQVSAFTLPCVPVCMRLLVLAGPLVTAHLAGLRAPMTSRRDGSRDHKLGEFEQIL